MEREDIVINNENYSGGYMTADMIVPASKEDRNITLEAEAFANGKQRKRILFQLKELSFSGDEAAPVISKLKVVVDGKRFNESDKKIVCDGKITVSACVTDSGISDSGIKDVVMHVQNEEQKPIEYHMAASSEENIYQYSVTVQNPLFEYELRIS